MLSSDDVMCHAMLGLLHMIVSRACHFVYKQPGILSFGSRATSKKILVIYYFCLSLLIVQEPQVVQGLR